MPKPVRKTKPAPKPPRYGAVLLRVAVELEAQGEAIERIEALLHDVYDAVSRKTGRRP